MEITILKTLGQIAGIGGLSLGVVLLIFREIIRKNIFPSLTKYQAYKVLRLIIISIWSIGIIGILAWTISLEKNASNHLIMPEETKSHLLGIVRDFDEQPIIDAKVFIDLLPNETILTTSDGGFYFKNIPSSFGERVRVYVYKKGYLRHNEYVTLPGPVSIKIEKTK